MVPPWNTSQNTEMSVGLQLCVSLLGLQRRFLSVSEALVARQTLGLEGSFHKTYIPKDQIMFGKHFVFGSL